MKQTKLEELIDLASKLTNRSFNHDCKGDLPIEEASEIYEMAHELLTKLETYAKEQERDHEIY